MRPGNRAAALAMYRVIGKVNMGMGLLECGILTLTPHLEPFPTSNQDVPGKTLPSVKSNWPAKATLGSMPFVLALFYHRHLRLFNFRGHWLLTTILPSHAPRPTPQGPAGQVVRRPFPAACCLTPTADLA